MTPVAPRSTGAAHDVSAEALFALLYSRTTVGYAVVGLWRPAGGGRSVSERHALDVADPSRWVLAVETAVGFSLHMELWPFVCGNNVLRNVGTAAFHPGKGSALRSYQATAVFRWRAAPAEGAISRFVDVGGHVIAKGRERFGLLPLDEARPLGALTHLTVEVATILGAEPLGYGRPIPVPGVAGAAFTTDPARAFEVPAVTSDELAEAGLRPSAVWPS